MTPLGLALDDEGCVWVGLGHTEFRNALVGPLAFLYRQFSAGGIVGGGFARVKEGGKILQTHLLSNSRVGYSCCLGGPDGKTLFMCCNNIVLPSMKMYAQPGASMVCTLRVEHGAARRPDDPSYNGGHS
eukprot:gnl/TRDRNA2_/TRDRNA2_149139_c0_seq1.p1 gnl/TRDRNA2_/TRDRNA2_149139_c0~~gnl/TRDRNA2_/TRDRNA2_149139_c0_seq1.p1  ORF type:complete len:129 (-),score=18.14 gnl/TRDRNA2_/TRDRNA2_149139_c0_seq1:106-492(-)